MSLQNIVFAKYISLHMFRCSQNTYHHHQSTSQKHLSVYYLWSGLQNCSYKVITDPIHRYVICHWIGVVRCILRWCMSCIPVGYCRHIVQILITSTKMSIWCMIFTDEVMKTHCCSHNHLLLGYWITWHLQKNSPLHLPYSKGALNDIANTWV
jgi:hypothetical protein